MSGIKFNPAASTPPVGQPKSQKPTASPEKAVASALQGFKWVGNGEVSIDALSKNEKLLAEFKTTLPDDESKSKLDQYIETHKAAEKAREDFNKKPDMEVGSDEYKKIHYAIRDDINNQITTARLQNGFAGDPPSPSRKVDDRPSGEKLKKYVENELGLSPGQIQSIKEQLSFSDGESSKDMSESVAYFSLKAINGPLPAETAAPAAAVAPPIFEMGPDDKSATFTKENHTIEIGVGPDGPEATIYTKNPVVNDKGDPVLDDQGEPTFKTEATKIAGDIGLDGSITFNLASSGIQLRVDAEKGDDGKSHITRVEISANSTDNHVLTVNDDGTLKDAPDPQGALLRLPTVHVNEIVGQQAEGAAGWEKTETGDAITDFNQFLAPAKPAQSAPPTTTPGTGAGEEAPATGAEEPGATPAAGGDPSRIGKDVTKEENLSLIKKFFFDMLVAAFSGDKDKAKVEGYFDIGGDLKTDYISFELGNGGLSSIFGPGPATTPKEPAKEEPPKEAVA